MYPPPLDQTPDFKPQRPDYKTKEVIIINIVLALLIIGFGQLLPKDFGFVGSGMIIMLQGGIGFFVGLIGTIIGKQYWALPTMLAGLVFGLIGFGVCTGGIMVNS
jgi:hypothetical protein